MSFPGFDMLCACVTASFPELPFITGNPAILSFPPADKPRLPLKERTMRRTVHTLMFYAAIAVSGTIATPARAQMLAQAGTAEPAVQEAYGRLPMYFEENVGQTGEQVRFIARGAGYAFFITKTETVAVFRKPRRAGQPEEPPAVVRMRLAGANRQPVVEGRELMEGKSNYFVGNDESRWRTNVSHFRKVMLTEVYPGIDAVYYGTQRQLEYDFVVRPGADPRHIRMQFEGAERIDVDAAGDLVIQVEGGTLRQRLPSVYQEIDGKRHALRASYVALTTREFGITVEAFDEARPLVIDPVLVYSTYLGGGLIEEGNDIAVSGGSTYVVGDTTSADFPPQGPYQLDQAGRDVFVTKLNASGSGLVYSTYLGGGGNDDGNGIAVDGAGSAYVTGQTDSTNFPTLNAYQLNQGGADAFVTKLNPSGSGLVYSTYLGGGSGDVGNDIAVDNSGRAHVCGGTNSTDFPANRELDEPGMDVFVTRLDETGALDYSTYVGGSGEDQALGIATNGQNSYVTGYTDSTDLTSGGFQSNQPGRDAFVVQVYHIGNLMGATYLGGSGSDSGVAITMSNSDVWVTGYTDSANFPTQNPYQLYQGGTDAFVTRLSAGSANNPMTVEYSTYLGGAGADRGLGIGVEHSRAYVTGDTDSTNFPTLFAYQTDQPGTDAFVTKFSITDSLLVYSTYLGGSGSDSGTAIAVETSGNAYVVGNTDSSDFPTVGPFEGDQPGSDTFVVKLVVPGAPSIVGLSPDCGPTTGGQTTIITGTNLTNPTSVTFAGIAATIGISNATSISVTTPARAAGSVNVIVVTEGGSNTANNGYSYAVPRTVTAGGATTFCAGGSVTLTSSSAPGNQWYLDGNPIAAATNQQYVATASGSYTVTSGCTTVPSAATTVTVNALPPTPSIGASGPTTFCAGGSVTLTSSSATGNQWSLAGTPIGGATGQGYIAIASGNYTVTVTDGCTSNPSPATTVTVNPLPTSPAITAGGATTFCAGGSVTLTSSSAIGNQWYLAGNPIGGATNQQYIVTASGNYTVSVTDGCTSSPSTATTVTVNALPPTPSISASATSFCPGGSVTLTSSSVTGNQWYLAGNPIGGATSQEYIVTASGNYTVSVTDGCTSSPSAATTVTVALLPTPPTIAAGGATTFCAGENVTLTSSSATGNQWYLAGDPIGGATNQTYSATASGNYTVTVNSSCTSNPSTATTVTVNPLPTPPTITAGGATTFCAGGNVTLTSSSTTGNQWYRDGTLLGSETGQTILATAGGNYGVTATDSGCTSARSSTTVTVHPKPEPTIVVASSMYSGASVTASVTHGCLGATFVWSIAGGTITAGNGTSSVTFTTGAAGTIELSVTVTTAFGCSNSTSASVTVESAPFGAPPFFDAMAVGTTGATLHWATVTSAVHYEIRRSTDNINWTLRGISTVATFSESGLTPSTTYLYKARAIRADMTASTDSIIDPATTIVLSDPSLTTCSLIRAVHITQLRGVIDAARASVGLPAFTFNDPSLGAGSPIKAVHVTELRAAMADFLNAIAVTPAFSDPTIVAGSAVKAAHLQELRDRVR